MRRVALRSPSTIVRSSRYRLPEGSGASWRATSPEAEEIRLGAPRRSKVALHAVAWLRQWTGPPGSRPLATCGFRPSGPESTQRAAALEAAAGCT